MGKITFKDSITIQPEVDKTIKDGYLNGGMKQPLIVKIAATHAGIVTRNNGFYLPDRMKKGAASFTAQYNKPIQIHHDSDADPIGRVLRADYVEITPQIRDGYKQKFNDMKMWDSTVNPTMLDAFIDGKLSYIQAVNFICDELAKSGSILEDPNYTGLGYIQLTAAIADPDAIQKILDGRYLTGSVGVSTNKAVCSVCKQDWADEAGRCEHKPGKNYDGAKAFLITGDLAYDEWSFVNAPADRHAKVEGLVSDPHLSINNSTHVLDNPALLATMNNIGDKNSMAQTITDSAVATIMTSLKTKFAMLDEAALAPLNKIAETFADMTEEELAANVEMLFDKAALEQAFALFTAGKKDEFKTAVLAIRPWLDEALIIGNATTKFEDFYEAINTAEWNDYSELEDEELNKYLVEHPEDAKLSSSKRKKLPGSTFCGPNRSFPVPDCAHVTAARRLIGRASASGATKSKILGCVSRKAKAMGCGGGKDALVESTTVVEDKKDCGCADTVSRLDAVTAELVKTKAELDALKVLHDELVKKPVDAKLTDELAATREELKLASADLVAMADELVVAKEKNLTLLAEKAVVFTTLSGTEVKDAKVLHDGFVTMDETKLTESLVAIMSKVDMTKIVDSINSGLARNPVGTIKDPSGVSGDPEKKLYDINQVKLAQSEFTRILLGGNSVYGKGQDAAHRYLTDMKQRNIIPSGE